MILKKRRIKFKSISVIVINLLLLVTFFSCQKDFSGTPYTRPLRFSVDTLFVDSLFSNISSSTKRFKVYNDSKDPVVISQIYLGRQDSDYRINIDGNTGPYFTDKYLRANDSMYVFVELSTANGNGTELTYKDSLVFESPFQKQDVKLIAQIFDAHFFYANENATSLDGEQTFDGNLRKIRVLEDEELVFTNDKAYVFYDYVTVPENKTLTVQAGAKLYFHDKSALIVPEGSSLIINGSLENPVHISGDKLSNHLKNIPGQWDGIWLQEGSHSNLIEFCQIVGASTGIRIEGNQIENSNLELHNVSVSFCSDSNLKASHSNINATNLILNNSFGNALRIEKGGLYQFNHCTIANYKKTIHRTPVIHIGNTNDQELFSLDIAFHNSIIDRNNINISPLIDFNLSDANLFKTYFNHCLINGEKNNFIPSSLDTNQTDTNIYSNVSDFKAPYEGDFRIGLESDAINNADGNKSIEVPLDFIGALRTNTPDIGAYQAINFEEETEENENNENNNSHRKQ